MPYTALQIIERAQSLGVTIALEQNRLALRAARPDLISDTMRARVREYKDALIAYLEQERIYELASQEACLCITCLDQGKETPALPDHHEMFMYCAQHHPAHRNVIL